MTDSAATPRPTLEERRDHASRWRFVEGEPPDRCDVCGGALAARVYVNLPGCPSYFDCRTCCRTWAGVNG